MRHTPHLIATMIAVPLIVSGWFALTGRSSAALETQGTGEGFFASPVLQARNDGEPDSLPAAGSIAVSPFGDPLSTARIRVAKKPFGLHIWPGHSPVENDRFSGYHVGVDFETFPEEKDVDIAVSAICDGPLLLKKYATGYGGVAVQTCKLDGREVQVIYGHLHLESIVPAAGERMARGDRIGTLGRGFSEETNGVRKHLHLGVRLADDANDIRGYVQDEAEIAKWLDPLRYMAE